MATLFEINTLIELLFKHLGSRNLIEYVQVKHTRFHMLVGKYHLQQIPSK